MKRMDAIETNALGVRNDGGLLPRLADLERRIARLASLKVLIAESI